MSYQRGPAGPPARYGSSDIRQARTLGSAGRASGSRALSALPEPPRSSRRRDGKGFRRGHGVLAGLVVVLLLGSLVVLKQVQRPSQPRHPAVVAVEVASDSVTPQSSAPSAEQVSSKQPSNEHSGYSQIRPAAQPGTLPAQLPSGSTSGSSAPSPSSHTPIDSPSSQGTSQPSSPTTPKRPVKPRPGRTVPPAEPPVGPAASNVEMVDTGFYGDGIQPVMSDGVLTTGFQPSQPPASTSMSGGRLHAVGDDGHYREGQRMHLEYTVTMNLGDSVNDDNGWFIAAQGWGMGGTEANPVWPHAAWTVEIRNGYWMFIAGNWNNGNVWVLPQLMPYSDGQAWRMVLDMTMSAYEGQASTTLVINGQTVIDGDTRPNLMPDNWNGVEIDLGIHEGVDSGSAPDYSRSAVYSHINLTRP